MDTPANSNRERVASNWLRTISYRVRSNTRLWAYATVLVAFFLRVYRLADKNIWWDEGWSLWLSQKDLAWIALRTAADEHPPLHYWMLHFWNALAGADAFAGRFLSVAFGVLTIALIYRIGKRVGGAGIGILAGLFLAIARFHIWWSQDIKNYTPSIFFAFAAVWFALILLDRPAWKSSIGYAFCAALALWTHYLAGLVLLVLNVYAAFVFLTKRQQVPPADSQPGVGHWHIGSPGHWLVANVLAAALIAPWLALYLQNAAAWSAAPAFDFGLFLKLVATVLPLGITTDIDNYAALTIALTTLAALGCIPQKTGGGNRSLPAKRAYSLAAAKYATVMPAVPTLFSLIVVLPPLLIYVLSLTPAAFFAPKIQARYLLILLPAYVVLLALGIALLKRFSLYLALAAMLFVLATHAFVLDDYYADRRLRDEYATLANTINSFAQRGDLVLLDTDQEWPTFLYYMRAPLDWLGVPNGQPMSAANADALVQRALARHDAIWLVVIPDALATDPDRWIEKRLTRRDFPQRFERTFDDKRLILFASAPRDFGCVSPENFGPQYLRSLKVDDNLQLLGFDLPVRQARVGDTVRIVTYWHVASTSAIEIELQGVETTTAHAPSGERRRVEADFVIPPNVQGDLPITVGGIELARIDVEPRPRIPPVNDISNRVDYRLGDVVHLVGYDLPGEKFRPGDSVPATLYWRADRAVQKSYTAFVHLLGTQFNPAHSPSNLLWGQIDRVPLGGYPTTAWLPYEIVPDPYRVPLDPRAPAGIYKIEIGLYDAATGVRLAVDGGGQDSIIIGEIEVVP